MTEFNIIFVVPASAGIETANKREKNFRENERLFFVTKAAATLTLPNNLQTEITNEKCSALVYRYRVPHGVKGSGQIDAINQKVDGLIADRFLDEDARKLLLYLRAQYAIAASGLTTVQNSITSELSGFTPTSAHFVIPKL